MRFLLVLVMLSLAACEGSFFRVSDLARHSKVDKAYQARDACLAKNAAADGTRSEDATMLADAVALACTSETESLVAASDTSGDKKVAAAIRQDSQFRAMKYVMQARGQVIY
ncbi:MAG: hypothetical protein ACOY4R_18065 [Pseudomonadota bacterium]